jgi:hypothetical protein
MYNLEIGDLVIYNYKDQKIVGLIINKAPFDYVYDVLWSDGDTGRYEADTLNDWNRNYKYHIDNG